MSNENGNTKELKFSAKINGSPQELANILQQITNNVDALTTFQFTITLAQPPANDDTLSTFVAIREAFPDAQNNLTKVKVTFLPGEMQAEPQLDISDGDEGEIIDWETLFDPHNIDINQGVCVVYLPPNGDGIAIWMPKDGQTNNVIVARIQEETPPTGSDSNLKKFRNCMRQQQQIMKKTYAKAFLECLHQL